MNVIEEESRRFVVSQVRKPGPFDVAQGRLWGTLNRGKTYILRSPATLAVVFSTPVQRSIAFSGGLACGFEFC